MRVIPLFKKSIKYMLIVLSIRIIISSFLSSLYTLKFFTFITGFVFLSIENFIYNAPAYLAFIGFLLLNTLIIQYSSIWKLIFYIICTILISIWVGFKYLEDFQIWFEPTKTLYDIIEKNYFAGYRFITMVLAYVAYVIIYYYKIEIPYKTEKIK